MKEHELQQALDNIQISLEEQQRILFKVKNYNNKRGCYKMSKKKICLVAAAATMVLGITVFAASGVIKSWNSSSSSIPDYNSLPTAEECMQDAGFSPVLIQSFENGYEFDNGSIVKNDLRDESDKSVEKFKSLYFRYEKNNDEVTLTSQKYVSEMDITGENAATVGNIPLYYSSYTNKAVPANYKLTEEDKKAEENGEFIFSYGANEVTVSKVQNLFWEEDGIKYDLMQIDGSLTKEELIDMAEELINK